jgi:hypothetical protein
MQLIMKDLEADLRKVMAPNTGAALRESKRNVLKDFVHIAGPLGVTHFLILTATQNASYLRIAKTPRVRSFPAWMPQKIRTRMLIVLHELVCSRAPVISQVFRLADPASCL